MRREEQVIFIGKNMKETIDECKLDMNYIFEDEETVRKYFAPEIIRELDYINNSPFVKELKSRLHMPLGRSDYCSVKSLMSDEEINSRVAEEIGVVSPLYAPINAFCTNKGDLIIWVDMDNFSENNVISTTDDNVIANVMFRHSLTNILSALTRVKPICSVLASKQFKLAVLKTSV